MSSAFRHSLQADGPEAGKVEIAGIVVHETKDAILLDDAGTRAWLPRSRITILEGKGGVSIVLLPEWLAKRKGLI